MASRLSLNELDEFAVRALAQISCAQFADNLQAWLGVY
jgi:hypothetical protein